MAHTLAAFVEVHRLAVVETMEARREAAKDLLMKAVRDWTEASCPFQ